jgi:hypothetical protein
MLSLWRRHVEKCPHRAKGRLWTKCSCPIWVDGEVEGRRIRESTGTRDWARAGRIAGKMEDSAVAGRVRKRIPEAIESFLLGCEIKASSMRRYRRVMKNLAITRNRPVFPTSMT